MARALTDKVSPCLLLTNYLPQDQALRHDLEGQLAAACRDNCILLQRLRDTATVRPNTCDAIVSALCKHDIKRHNPIHSVASSQDLVTVLKPWS